MTRISKEGITIIAIGFIISRALSGLAVVNFKSAKGTGLAASFKEASHKKIVTFILLVIFFVCVTGLFVFFDIYLASAAVISSCIVFLYYKYMAYKQFGGTTGDIAGYFLVVCELWILIGVSIWN